MPAERKRARKPTPAHKRSSLWIRIRTGLFGILFLLIATATLVFQFSPANQVELTAGDVSGADIRAPRRFSYESQVLTEQERKRAEAQIPDVYDPPQARIARQQIERARAVLAFVGMVRADPYAANERKVAWLGSISDVSVPPQVAQYAILFSDPAWNTVATEIVSVLDQTMRGEIRSYQLEAVRRSVPASVNPELSEQQNDVVSTFVQGLLKPNTIFNAGLTATARQKAREAVPPISRTFAEGEVILRAGDIVNALDVEALQELGLKQEAMTWEDIASAGGYVLLCCIWLGLYLFRYAPKSRPARHDVTLLFFLLVFFTVLAKVMIPGQVNLAYLFPIAAMSMLLTVLVDFQLSLVATLTMAMLVGYLSGGSLELTVYCLIGGLVGSLILGRAERLSAYLWSGLFVSLVNVAVILVFRLPGELLAPLGLLTLVGAGLGNGLICASVTVASFYFLGSVFGITTNLALMELSRPTQPLLRELLLNAPGTFHHSIMVSNLAEHAANRIGADALLARVGAYYHDIGKIKRPYFFAENQMDGVNVHQRLDPETSAEIVQQHVTDGLALASEYKLPARVRAFIPEHHGTTVAAYFYHMALKEAEDESQVNEDGFRYPGPRPQSRETAILMLADGSESAVRSVRPTSVQQIEETVDKVFKARLLAGQFDECDLTMRDIQEIRRTFVTMLEGVFHPRVQYPSREEKRTPAAPTPAAAAGKPKQ